MRTKKVFVFYEKSRVESNKEIYVSNFFQWNEIRTSTDLILIWFHDSNFKV